MITTYAAPPRSFDVTSPLREGEVGSFHVTGQPGDQAWLLIAPGAGWTSLPGKQGVLVVNSQTLSPRILVLGTVGGTGSSRSRSLHPR